MEWSRAFAGTTQVWDSDVPEITLVREMMARL